MKFTRRAFTVLACLSMATGGALAQDKYPSKPIRIIVPFPPGASTDIIARTVAPRLSASMGVPVIVENRGGASGITGSDALARSVPDGYTIGIAVPATHSLPVALSRKMPYDPIKDFTPLGILVNNPLATVVTPDLPVNSLKELVDYARKHPGELSYGTSGAGSSQHLVGEMLNQFAKINIVHIPYKGGSGSLNDLLGGQIQVGQTVISSVLPHVKAGKLKMLAVMDEHRYSELPNVPTNHEALPGFNPLTSWIGMLGPAHMDPAVVARLETALRQVLREPAVAQSLNKNGMPVVASTAAEFSKRLREDIEGWTPIVKAGNISAAD